MSRSFDRSVTNLRPLTATRNYLKDPLGSCLIEFGDTKVLCAVTITDGVGVWRAGKGLGWVTAEYAMLPAATTTRTRRETKGRTGRSQEIQRLIGRSLRTVVDMSGLGECTVTVDCDVIQADGGTRTAAITGAWIALYDALEAWKRAGKIAANPIVDQVAAISVGLVDGEVLLDLDYSEDSIAEVDMNIVQNSKGEFIEIQGTGEQVAFSRERMNEMLDVATAGIAKLLEFQRTTLGIEA